MESDSLELIETCKGEKSRGEIEIIVSGIIEIKKNFTSCEFLWTNRGANKVADCVANLASTNSLPRNWFFAPPIALRSLLLKDAFIDSGSRGGG